MGSGRAFPPEGAGSQSQAGKRFGPYVVEETLGQGGGGIVFRARHADTGVVHALKVILTSRIESGDGERAFARFRREAEVLARIEAHEAVVRVHAFGVEGGVPWCAMDFVEGQPLSAVLKTGAMRPAKAARMVATVARAVHHVHAHGVIHRDLKPDNIIIDAQGRPRVVDFGLAYDVFADRLTRTGEFLGTPHYMAPEQVSRKEGEGEGTGAAADVYGLGAILYHTLTGRPPFDGSTAVNLVMAVIEKMPVPPSKRAPSVPRELDAVCLRALRKVPAERYASALEMALDLERWARGESVSASRVTNLSSILKPWRLLRTRRGRLTVGITLGVWIGLAGAIGASWLIGGALERGKQRAAVDGAADVAAARLAEAARLATAVARREAQAAGRVGAAAGESEVDDPEALARAVDQAAEAIAALEHALAEATSIADDPRLLALRRELARAGAVARVRAAEGDRAAVLAAAEAALGEAALGGGAEPLASVGTPAEAEDLLALGHAARLIVGGALLDLGRPEGARVLAPLGADAKADARLRAAALFALAEADPALRADPDALAGALARATALDPSFGERVGRAVVEARARAGDVAGALGGVDDAAVRRNDRKGLIARVHWIAGRHERALEAADEVLRTEPDNAIAGAVRVQCLLDGADEAEARRVLRRLPDVPARARRRDRAARLRLRAEVEAANGEARRAEAKEAEAAALVDAAGVPWAAARARRRAAAALARAVRSGAAEELARAEALCGIARARGAADGALEVELAVARVRAGEGDRAREALGRIGAEDTAAPLRVARLLLMVGDAEGALALLERVEPTEDRADLRRRTEIARLRARAQLALGRTPMALAALSDEPRPTAVRPGGAAGSGELMAAEAELLLARALAAGREDPQFVWQSVERALGLYNAGAKRRADWLSTLYRSDGAGSAEQHELHGEALLRDPLPLAKLYPLFVGIDLADEATAPQGEVTTKALIELAMREFMQAGKAQNMALLQGQDADLRSRFDQAERLVIATMCRAPDASLAFAGRSWARLQQDRASLAIADTLRARVLAIDCYQLSVHEAAAHAYAGDIDAAVRACCELLSYGFYGLYTWRELLAWKRVVQKLLDDPRWIDLENLSRLVGQDAPLPPDFARQLVVEKRLEPWKLVAIGYHHYGHRQLTEALQCFDEAVKLLEREGPEAVPPHLRAARATLLIAGGRYAQALPDLRDALARTPRPPAPSVPYCGVGYEERVFEVRRELDDPVRIALLLAKALRETNDDPGAFEVLTSTMQEALDAAFLTRHAIDEIAPR